jgi:beta-galactosidase
MATITYDGHSFMLDGRRVWLVSGSIHMARTPRAQWAERIAAAKRAGLNTVETAVVWARHEPRQGQFDFSGDNDLRHFVQLCQKAGMYVVLRPGPFVGAGYDLGGLPPWLLNVNNVKLRTANAPFLDASSRFVTALAAQVKDLQLTSPSKGGSGGGPIILIQNEGGWTCGDDTLASGYLGELDRYYREAGLTVPIVNANDLWQSVEGEIDGWTGFDSMLSHLRQLAAVRPTQPRLVMSFRPGRLHSWGGKPALGRTPGAVLRRLAEVIAAGGQFNIDPFAGGTNFGFSAGRDPHAHDGFLTTSNDAGAPLTESGQPGKTYSAVRRICTFASRFGRLLSHLEPQRQTVALVPESRPGRTTSSKQSDPTSVAVVHASGTQGSVVFVFGDEGGDNGGAGRHTLLLPDGSTLPVELSDQSVVWCLLDTRLAGRAQLDYCNLCAFALVGKVFVCFGPEGSKGMMSINGSPLEVEVPSGKNPVVVEHEGMTVVVASHAQLEHVHCDDNAVYLGVAGIDAEGKVLPLEDHKQYVKVDADGKPHAVKAQHAAAGVKKPRLSLGEWSPLWTTAYADGTSPRYAAIQKPADLVTLGAPYGYGWYRAKFTVKAAGKRTVLFPQGGHRLHVTLDGEPAGLVGLGPGAEPLASLNFKKGEHTMVVLAENLGRVSGGADLGEPTGLAGHAWAVEPIKPGKAKLVSSEPVDLLQFRAPLWRIHRDDTTDAQRLHWSFPHTRKTPVIMRIGAFTAPESGGSSGGVVLLNGKPVHFFPIGGGAPLVFTPDVLGRGKVDVEIAIIGSTAAVADELAHAVAFFEGDECLTENAEWAFAKWEPPSSEAFGKKQNGKAGHGPAWYRAYFDADDSDVPVWFDTTGLSKGQIYVNGKHAGRFFTQTAAHKNVPPQHRYLLPRPWLKPEGNELVIFDEHGFSPGKSKLVTGADVTAFDE